MGVQFPNTNRKLKLKRTAGTGNDKSNLLAAISKLEQELAECRNVQKDVREYQTRCVEILESITDSFYAIDKQWRFTYINKEAAKFVTGKEKGLIGKNILEAFPSLVGSNVAEYFRRVMAEQVAIHFETKSNVFSDIWFEMHVYPTTDGLCVYFRDISKQKLMQQKLSEAQKLEAIGQLAGGLAHDLNNQLTIIMGYSDLRLNSLLPGSPFYNDFLHIKKAVEKSVNLTRQLLMFSRKQPLNKEIIDLNGHLLEFQVMLTQLIAEGVTLHFDLAPNLWLVNADVTNIEQVIANLTLNARDSMPAGGKITFTTENLIIEGNDSQRFPEIAPGYYVAFTVKDTGSGIAEQIIPHIFEPFFSTKERTRGTGLGLAVVYGIMKAHGGGIYVQSQIGQGSQFEVLFPAIIEQTDSRKTARTGTTVSLETYRGQGERFLLLEDEKEILEIIQSILTTNGFKVFPCSRVSEALMLFRREGGQFDLIISDAILPDGRGDNLILQLLQKKPSLKSMLMSGYPGERIQLENIQKMGIPFLAKPFSAKEFLQLIFKILY